MFSLTNNEEKQDKSISTSPINLAKIFKLISGDDKHVGK